MNFNDNYSLQVTDAPTLYVRWQHWNWIVPEIVNSIFILMTLWIITSLIYYGNKSKKWVTTKERNSEKLNAGYILMAAVLCAVTALLRFTASQFVFNIGFSYGEDEKCKIAENAAITTFCLATFCVYIYLWIRQIVFYTNRMLYTEFSKGVRFFSCLSIILIFLGGLGAMFINTIPTKYQSTSMGCVYVSLDSFLTIVSVIVSSLVLLAGQITLVSLLFYPLHRLGNKNGCLKQISHSYSKKKQSSVHMKNCNKIQTHHAQSVRKIRKILRKTVIFSVIIVSSDIASYLVSAYAFSRHDNRRIPTMLYDIGAFANLVFVFTSIENWKRIARFAPPVYSASFSLNTPRVSRIDHHCGR